MKKRLFTLMAALLVLATGHAATSYGFNVAGVEITSDNYTNIPNAIKKADASRLTRYDDITFNPSKNTLTLTNVTIKRTGSKNRAITNDSKTGLIVVFVGSNTLEAANASPILCKTTTYLKCQGGSTGSDNVVLKGNHNDGLTANGCKVYIREANMTVEATNSRGIMSDNNNGEVFVEDSKVTVSGKNGAVSKLKSLTVQNSTLTLNGNGSAVTVNTLQSLVLEKSGYNYPQDAFFQTGYNSIWTYAATSGYTGTIEFVPALKINEENFPDPNFRAYVGQFDTNKFKDYHLTENERSKVKQINVSNKGISNLKGVEHFTSLTELFCGDNQLTSLDVSNNTALTYLSCGFNQLTRLDVSKNTELTRLNCRNNQLTSLNVSTNTALTQLYCSNNQLTSLNVSKNIMLELLECYSNKIKGTNMTNFVNSLPKKTGNLSLNMFPGEGNESVYEDIATAQSKGWNVDYYYNSKLKMYAPAVGINTTNFPDANFRAWVSANADTYKDGFLIADELNNVKEIDVSSKNISNLTGIERFTALTELDCHANQLTNLDVSENTALKKLNCYANQLTALDVTKNTALTYLSCYYNIIGGSKMSALVQSLPTVKEGELYVKDESINGTQELNYFDMKLAKTAKDKGWTPYVLNAGWQEYTSIATDIDAVPATEQTADGGEQPHYNLQGQRVGRDYRGVVIVNGRKVKQ